MSDTSQGPGWWLASDGQWYPPHLHPAMEIGQPSSWLSYQPSVQVSTRAVWSVVLPVLGWFAAPVILELSNHVGNVSTSAGINASNQAGVAAFFICALVAWVAGGCSLLLATSAKREIRFSNGALTGGPVATVGLVLSIILVCTGLVEILVGVFLHSLNSLTF